MEPCFYVTSDYKTVVTWLKLEKQYSKDIHQWKFRLDNIDENKFVIGLETQKDLVYAALASTQCDNPSNIREALDKSAETIRKAIYSSLELFT